MPRMSGSTAVTTGAVSANVLAGQLYEFAPYRKTAILVLAVTTATGVNLSFTIGQTAIVQDQLVSFANRFPQIPEDKVLTHGAFKHERLFMTFRNTTAGTLTITWVVDVEAA